MKSSVVSQATNRPTSACSSPRPSLVLSQTAGPGLAPQPTSVLTCLLSSYDETILLKWFQIIPNHRKWQLNQLKSQPVSGEECLCFSSTKMAKTIKKGSNSPWAPSSAAFGTAPDLGSLLASGDGLRPPTWLQLHLKLDNHSWKWCVHDDLVPMI